MISGQTTYPRMSRPEQAYVQIDQVGQFTAAAGCAIYEGGAWPEKWRYSYFTGEPTLNLVHHQFVKPDGVSYTTEKEKGREQTEFMRSGDMVVPADRDARRARRRPLHRRLLQPGRHPQRHARTAARARQCRRPSRSRPLLRPDLARTAQAGDQARRAGVESQAISQVSSGRSRRARTPRSSRRPGGWRRRTISSDPRLARIKKPMGSTVLALYERALGAKTAAAAKGAARHVCAGDRQLDAVGDRRRGDRAAVALRCQRLGVRTSAGPGGVRRPRRASRAARERRPVARRRPPVPAPQASVLKATVVRAVARMEGGTIAMDAATTAALQKLLDDPATTAAALPIVAKWDKAGALSAGGAIGKRGAWPRSQRVRRSENERRSSGRARGEPARRAEAAVGGAGHDRADAG